MALTTDLTLPSGITVKVREVSLFALIHTGAIPNPLLPLIRAGISGSAPSAEEIEAGLQAEDGAIQQYVDFFINYARKSLVSPRLVESDTPGEGELSIWDLSDSDYVAIFTRSQFEAKSEAVADLKPFRDEPRQDGQAIGDEPDLEGAAV